jgi:Tol biopolymer transport system component
MSKRLFLGAFVALAAAFLPQAGVASGTAGGGGQIVFGTLHAGEDEIWVMNADGTNKHNLTRHDGAKISDVNPRFSPDGRQIAFSSDPGGDREVWVMNADGSGAHKITKLPGANLPSWTANGNAIVFQSENSGDSEIYWINTDGNGLTDLTNDHSATDWSPAASTRGNKIVFTSDRDGNGHLYVLDADGTLTRITNGSGYDFFADWSPRGNEIAFSRDDGSGSTDLYLVHSDGSGLRRLTNTPGVLEYFPAFSPDGTKLAYSACKEYPVEAASFRCSTHVMNLDGSSDTNLAFAPLALPFPITDDFNNNTRNVDLWSIIHDGTGGFVQWTSSQLEMTIASEGVPDSNSSLGVHVGANCLLGGDFDAQVDYQLLSWPAGDGVNVGITAFFTNGAIERATNAFGEFYDSSLDPVFQSVPTEDQSGSLRLVRSGATITSYYRSPGGNWVQLASAPAQQTTAIVALAFKSYADFGHQEAKVAFDNFRLDAANVDCSSVRPDFHPDWQPLE